MPSPSKLVSSVPSGSRRTSNSCVESTKSKPPINPASTILPSACWITRVDLELPTSEDERYSTAATESGVEVTRSGEGIAPEREQCPHDTGNDHQQVPDSAGG